MAGNNNKQLAKLSNLMLVIGLFLLVLSVGLSIYTKGDFLSQRGSLQKGGPLPGLVILVAGAVMTFTAGRRKISLERENNDNGYFHCQSCCTEHL